MTAAEVKRLERYLEANLSRGGVDVSDEVSTIQFKKLVHLESFQTMGANAFVMIRDSPKPHMSVLATMAMMFRHGQLFERAEQMRREFGDEVPR